MSDSPYIILGGEQVVRTLVDRFYDLMDKLPEAAVIRAMHPPSLEGSRDKLFWFLCGWLGGPQLFVEKFGHPRLRARHLPFAIDTAAKDAWMLCMNRAIDEVIPLEQQHLLREPLDRLADHMRNRPN